MAFLNSIGGWLSGAFLAPNFLWFLGLIPIVVLLYLLKLRRTRVVIPSTMLWTKSLQDLTANAPFQRLRKNLLMFLQILVLLLAALALARPFVRAQGMQGEHYALVIDRSASMQTWEGGSTRLDLAKQEALDMIDAMKGGDQMMVVGFAESADVLCELTSDRFRLRSAVRSLEPSDTRTNIRDVMMIGRSLAPDDPSLAAVVSDLRMVLFSDGKLSDRDDVGARAINMIYRKIGSSTNNAGIVGFSTRKPEEGQSQHQTFVLVHNEHTSALDSTLSLFFEDSLIAVEEIAVPPGEDREVLFAHGDFGHGVLRVELDHEDDLGVDNRAWLTLRPASRVRVLLVGAQNSTSSFYLKRALGLEPRVELSAVSPEDYLVNNDFDLTIFNGFDPEVLPAGSMVFFDSLPPIPGVGSSGEIENPPVLATDKEHPAMRFLNPGNLGVLSARRLELPSGSKTLISTRGGPLIADVSRGGQQILIVAFDLSESNWPLRLSFPLFIQNVVSWTPRASQGGGASVSTGDSIALMPAPDVEVATITPPGDAAATVMKLDPLRPVYFGATEKAGIYSIRRGDETEQVAVNLLHRGESSIAPTESIGFGRGAIVAEHGPVKQTRELWRWFVWVAVAILIAEWWVYSRRAWL